MLFYAQLVKLSIEIPSFQDLGTYHSESIMWFCNVGTSRKRCRTCCPRNCSDPGQALLFFWFAAGAGVADIHGTDAYGTNLIAGLLSEVGSNHSSPQSPSATHSNIAHGRKSLGFNAVEALGTMGSANINLTAEAFRRRTTH